MYTTESASQRSGIKTDMGHFIPPSPSPSAEGLMLPQQPALQNSAYLQPAGLRDGYYGYPQIANYPPLPCQEDGLDGFGSAGQGHFNPNQSLVNPYLAGGDTMGFGHTYSPGQTYLNPQMYHPFTPERSPVPATQSIESGQRRSTRTAARDSPTARSKAAKTARVEKRAARKRRTKESPPSLVKPLSEVAKDLPAITVFDIDTFVNRTTETRRQEAARDNKIKRPLNAFILYRKAYQKVAMAYCGTNLNQSASEFCGDSWRQLEPAHIRTQFKAWADIEVRKHKEAHPSYKYVPKKSEGEVFANVDEGETVGSEAASRSARQSMRREMTQPQSHQAQERDQTPHFEDHFSMKTGDGANEMFSGSHEMHASQENQWGGASIPAAAQVSYPHVQAALANETLYNGHDQLFGRQAAPELDWMNPNITDSGAAIDPRLFSSSFAEDWAVDQYNMPFDNLEPEQKLAALMPDLDADGAHNAYLRGRPDDWDVEQLNEADIDEAFRSENFMTLAEPTT